jgi:signal transduction histidine kinase
MGDTKRDGRRVEPESSAGTLSRQRAITERLLLTALRQRAVTGEAVAASRQATFLAAASRELAMSLDDSGTREAIRRRTLLREGSWCIVDVVELDGAVHRLSVAHPDPAKQQQAQALADRWFPTPDSLGNKSGSAVVVDANEIERVSALREFGIGGVIVVPLVVRGRVLGAITFVAQGGDPAFTPDEFKLASDLADLCALALENERLYREAQALRAAADEANRAKSTFLGNMSHELMTPLNAIGGYASLIEMGLRGPVTAMQKVDLERIRHNQAHLLTLISEILSYVRSDTGRLEYRFSEVSVDAAMHEVADMLQGAVDERQLVLVYHPGADSVMWADADRVRQILLNLVMNAVKYATVVHGQIILSISETPATVLIHVSDDGPGIPVEKLVAIFDPFVQLANGLSDRRGGVGLGLAISRDLARAMNGELTVESTVGAGSRFTLELPRAPYATLESK